MKPRTFVGDIEMFSRFLIFLAFLFYTTTSYGLKPHSIYSNKIYDFSPFEENGKFGLKNKQGQILIPAQYDQLGWSDGSFSVVENVTGYFLNGFWGLINLSNHKVTIAEFADLSPGQGSLVVARKRLPNSVLIKSGAINTAGKIVIPFDYDGIRISSLRAIVYEKTGAQFRHGLINFENKEVIPLQYAIIYPLGSLRYAAVNFQNKTAIFSEEGNRLTDFSIDSISSFKKNYAVIFQDQKQGVINRAGDIVLNAVYREIVINDDGTIRTKMADTWTIVQGDNSKPITYAADSLSPLAPGVFKIVSGNRTSLVDKNLKAISPNQFVFVGEFQSGKAIFTDASGKKGLLRTNGTIAIPAQYERLVRDGAYVLAQYKTTEGLRCIVTDTAGVVISKKNYQTINAFNGKFFPVQNKGYFGALDASGKEIIACVHDSILQHREGLVVVRFKGQYGIINTREEWLVTPKPHRLELVNSDIYIEHTSPNKFLKSIKGQIIYFTPNRFEVKKSYLQEYLPSGAIMKVGFNGVILEKLMEDDGIQNVFTESEGYRAIKKDGRYGFIDSRSRLRIANRYEDVKNFSEGLAAAKILGKWGFVNKEDKIAVQPVYEEVFSFKEGFAIVRQKDLYGLIDKSGKVVLPVRYQRIEILPTRRMVIMQNEMYGLADGSGKILINPKFNSIEDVGNDYVIVQRDGKYGVLSTNGLSTIPLIYDFIQFDAFHSQFLTMQKTAWVEAKL